MGKENQYHADTGVNRIWGIPQNEAVHRLEALLQTEIERKDRAADMELVEACEELLWQIGTQGRLKFEDKRKENQAALMRRLERKRRRTAALRMGTRAAAAFAVILVLAVLGDGILKREWLSGNSTEDEQQYAIQGQSIDPGLVEEGVAAGDDNIADRLITTDWGVCCSFSRNGAAASRSSAGRLACRSLPCDTI